MTSNFGKYSHQKIHNINNKGDKEIFKLRMTSIGQSMIHIKLNFMEDKTFLTKYIIGFKGIIRDLDFWVTQTFLCHQSIDIHSESLCS